ncbi:unknown [Clostridium sp. CAG:762]|nr:unknown [Clostridium sp. CAG:762]
MKDIFKDKNKRTIFLTLIFSFILILIGTTYAYFSWQSTNNPLVNITVEDLGDVIFKGGNEIKTTNIGPVLDYNDGEITAFYIKKKMDNNLDININITPTILPDSLKDESFKVKLLSSTDNITYTEIKEDNFKDKETNIKFTLSTTELTNKLTYFKIIFYIDGNMLNSNNMKGQSFGAKIDISVDSQCPKNTVTPVYTDTSGANAPVLAEGMIPVVYDEGLGYWIKADINAGWYNYTDKIWANAVMVKTDATEGVECSKSRSYYMNAPAYTPVKEDDILAYYVWIPRYKYKLFNATYASGTSAQVIDVTFENGTSTTGNVTCTYDTSGNETCQNKANGNWYTHPAFTLGDTELKGIWVGKFETMGSTTTPTVKPGLYSVTAKTVSSMYNASKLFRSTDYLTTNGVTCTYDTSGNETCQNKSNGNWYTHPAFTFGDTELKGIWVGKFETTGSGMENTTITPTVKPGVASLRNITIATMYSASKLIRSTDYLTTNGANESDSHMMKNIEWGAVAYLKQSIYGLGITDITINSSAYTTGGGSGTSYKTNIGQSTTGNITGVYDMSGGSYEYVMGNYNKQAGNSGLTISTVPTQYIDIYSGTSVSASHLGDALGETAGWYSDYYPNFDSSNPWFYRGGFSSEGGSAGVFSFFVDTGEGNLNYAFRVVLSTTGA